MKVLWLLVLASIVATLVGCAKGSVNEIAYRSPDQLESVSDGQLIAVYGIVREPNSLYSKGVEEKFRTEIRRRQLFSDAQWQLIDAREIKIGQPEALVWASWGEPDDVVESVSEMGKTRSLWYQDSTAWVYTDGQKITGWVD